MKEIIRTVIAWDDADAHEGLRTEATDTVLLAMRRVDADGRVVFASKVDLDLTAEHADELQAGTARWFAAGQRVKEKSRSGKATVSPIDRALEGLGLPPHSAERRQWLRQFRGWVFGQGRQGEIMPGDDTKYYYPATLVQEYLASLKQQAS